MRNITIIGGGQSGLQLGIGLLQAGHHVRIVQNRTAEDIASGRVLSSQCMFSNAVQHERDLGIDFWSDTCPPVEGINFIVPNPDGSGSKAIDWAARLDHNAYSVDQRVKIPRWMAEFSRLGGQLVIADAGIAEIETYARQDDLVIVASGKGEVGRMFSRDPQKSAYDKPMRALALTYVTGMTPREPHSAVEFNLIPGVGEYFVFPALTTSGPCEIMVFEGVPGGPMDRWAECKTPDDHLKWSLKILETHIPWEAERCRHVELTDDNGVLAGRFPPTIRKPVGVLPSGRQVMGLGDAVCVNDPITGQGSNNATKAFQVAYDSIVACGDGDFDAAWMSASFERFWTYAGDVVRWTNSMLEPPPPHILKLLVAAGQAPAIAGILANNFNNPPDYFPWWADAQACDRFIERHALAA